MCVSALHPPWGTLNVKAWSLGHPPFPGALRCYPVTRPEKWRSSGDSARVRTRRPSAKSLQVYYSSDHTEECAD